MCGCVVSRRWWQWRRECLARLVRRSADMLAVAGMKAAWQRAGPDALPHASVCQHVVPRTPPPDELEEESLSGLWVLRSGWSACRS